MCGLAGVAARPGYPIPVHGLERARAALAHRGPDDRGTWCHPSSGVGLVHTRLSILDLSPRGHQPMSSRDGLAVVAYNGEIYNFRELGAALVKAGVPIESRSDTEVLLALYRLHGEAMLPMLDGMFAFALWDAAQGALLLARDACGIKPLYYAAHEGGVAFASELKALLPLLPDPGPLDVEALARYMTFLWCPGDATPLRAVRRLPPGTLMRIRDGVATPPVEWARFPLAAGVPQNLTQAEAVDGVRQRLRDAVHRQLVSDVPVGAFLSGGVDSSAVVAFARERVPDIRCFTIAADGWSGDAAGADLPYARRVAAHLQVPLEVVQVESGRMADDLLSMVRQLDEPLADPAALNVRYISGQARRLGISVLLSGAGGDDLFTGYRRHAALPFQEWWAHVPAYGREAVARWSRRLDQQRPFTRRLTKALAGGTGDAATRLAGQFHWASPDRLRALWLPEHRAQLDLDVVNAPLRSFLGTLPGALPPLSRLLALEQRFFLADHNLLYTDKMSMAEGVEVRVPFLDAELVAFAARIPDGLQQRGSGGKRVLKAALDGMLPADVLHRPKVGFGAPVRQWLRGPLQPFVRDVLSPEALRRRAMFDPAAVASLIADDNAGRVDGAYTLLSLICIELWCRTYLEAS